VLTTRLAAPLTVCVVAALALPATATASTGTSNASGRTEHVLLTLKPHNRGALRALAQTGTHRGAARAAALAAALPSNTARATVASTAQSLGLHVDRVSRLAVLVSAPAARIRALFGSARAVNPHSPMQHPLPAVPAALRGYVTVALGGDDNRPAFRHFALPNGTADGTDFRTAYEDTVTNPLTAPTAAEQNEAIATVQLSGWHSSDLTKYAAYLRDQTQNPAWPAPKYTTIDDPFLPSCIGTNNNAATCSNFPGDDVEVDLDQEAIYATAPYAHQRAYTSGNDLLGLYDSLLTIGDDATDPTVDRHLVAASISWGFCETDLDSDPSANELYASFEDAISYALATGVTVFAATGDSGGFCDGKKPGVSYPASSPQVVAVGGTSYATSVATDPPTGWVDPGWTPGNTQGLGAAAGGVSTVFPRPQYQSDAGITTTGRSVPDISALAGDPGFDVLNTRASGSVRHIEVGGTSVSSPVSAATYALQVANHNYSWGVGDILPGLYAQPNGFTDVDDKCKGPATACPGWNGADVAKPGYDLVTGLGTPKWSTLVSAQLGGDPHLSIGQFYNSGTRVAVTVHKADWQNFDRFRVDVDSDHVCTVANATATPPTSVKIDDFGFKGLADGVHDLTLVAFNSADQVCHFADAFVSVDTTAPSPLAKLSVGHGRDAVVAHWSGGDSGGSGIKTWHVTLGYAGHTLLSTTTSHQDTVRVPAKRGKTYTLTVGATDRAGNSHTTKATLVDDAALTLRGKWGTNHSSADFAGTAATSTSSHARSSSHLSGSAFYAYVTTCSACGKFAVFVDGKKRKTINTYSARTKHRVGVTLYSTLRNSSRHITLKLLGTHSHKSHGSAVFLDALSTRS
jgi:kumamolisin